MPGPTTRAGTQAQHGTLAGGQSNLSGVAAYILDKRAGMDFLAHALTLPSGAEANIDVAAYDASRTEIPVYDPAERIAIGVYSDDEAVCEVLTEMPAYLAVRHNATTGRPEMRVRVRVRGRGTGSASLTLSGTASTVTAGLVLSGALTVTGP